MLNSDTDIPKQYISIMSKMLERIDIHRENRVIASFSNTGTGEDNFIDLNFDTRIKRNIKGYITNPCLIGVP